MRRKWKHALTLTLALSAIIVGFNRCEKGPEEFGEQIMHPGDSISAKYDTTYVLDTRVVPTDSFSTLYHFFNQPDYINNYAYVLIGGYENPFFGKLKTSFVTQVEKTDSVNFAGDTLEAVGADLYFKMNKRYGELSAAQFNIYKINQDLEVSDPYYNTTPAENFFNAEDIISESTSFQGDSIIKVTLSQEFANFLTTADDTTMGDASDFKDFFQGFYAEMEYSQDKGFINKLNLTNDTSRLELAVKKSGSGEDPDTLTYRINSSSIRFNMFHHDYDAATHAEVNVNNFLNNDEAENDSILLISGLGGPRGKLTIPEGVKQKFNQDSTFLSRAEIQFKPIEQYNIYSGVYFPEQVGMYMYTNDTSYVNISNNQFFNGRYDEEANVYSCNITSYLQAYINGDVGNTLYLHTYSYQSEPGQMIVSGSGSNQPLKIRIKYFKP